MEKTKQTFWPIQYIPECDLMRGKQHLLGSILSKMFNLNLIVRKQSDNSMCGTLYNTDVLDSSKLLAL